MANPIWKDFYVNLGTDESVQFRIAVHDIVANTMRVIYTGKAYKRPGQKENWVRINDICADYLKNEFPVLSDRQFTGANQPVTFTILTMQEGSLRPLTSVQFDNDWSYDYAYDPATMGMSFPVKNMVDRRQWMVFTAYNASTIKARIAQTDGMEYDIYIPAKIGVDFNDDFNADFSKSVRSAQTGTAVFDLSQWDNVKTITIGDKVFKVVNTCCKYALYYVNAHGGWDSLLIEGNHSEADNLTRYTRETEYDNRSIQNRGVHNYVNEVSKTITLHTSWLSDDESSRMHHLLNSTDVYLGDLETGQMIPVILTDTRTDYKTYKGNGGKLVNYSINVTIAQERIRR